MKGGPRVAALRVRAFRVPTEQPESDGTLQWDAVTMVAVEATAGGARGLGYTYSSPAAALVVEHTLAPAVLGAGALDVPRAYSGMRAAVRNLGHGLLTHQAISAVDVALWDLKARLLGTSLVGLLGRRRDAVPAYASGGFTSYTVNELERRFAAAVQEGFGAVKMKVGRDPEADPGRVAAVRRAVSDHTGLYVDANGAYRRKQALDMAGRFGNLGVTWFEEPVSSDDLEGLRLLRDRGPAGMDIAAGEYGHEPAYFLRMAAAGAVEVLQPDVTRCGGITGFLAAAAVCDTVSVPVSSHTAPALSAHVCAAVERLRPAEYFHDHALVEQSLLDGLPRLSDGALIPDADAPGHGLVLKEANAAPFLVYEATLEGEP